MLNVYQLARLAILFGIERVGGYQSGSDKRIQFQARSARWKIYFDNEVTTSSGKGWIVSELWKLVKPVLLKRLQYSGLEYVDRQWVFAGNVCQMLRWNATEMLAEAVTSLPEPKGWAKLNADGTPKTKPEKKTSKKKGK